MNKEIDHNYTDKVVCPHCDYEYKNSYEWTDGDYDCDICERFFSVERITIVQFTTRKIKDGRTNR